ncbi:deoxyguanosinetriphosphate triphosphohydrolase, partial [bacterium]|nr:deoxyguanosinetriphosphate triphosphohydrolase [bacterium]
MFVTRETLENKNVSFSPRHALCSGESRGRFHQDHEPEYRTAFQRDRDRIVHAAAFRR